jgi:DNA-binding MarR family transcriptional regulator
MKNVARIFELDRFVDELDPKSRVAVVMAQVQSLAEQALATDVAAPTSPEFVRQVIAARTARRQFFEGDLFADPAWDILLELYALRCEQRRISVSKLCMAAGVPGTTALRWIEKLHKDSLIERSADPLDARRVWVTISDPGFELMRRYLQQLRSGSLPL